MENAKGPIEARNFIESAAYLLRETFEGSPEGQGSAYLDQGIGIFSTLNSLTAEDVSKNINGATIVAQVEHTKFYLDRLCEFMNGRTDKVNWDDSWLIETVNDAEWAALRETVKKTYEDALICFAAIEDWNEDRVGMAIGMIAHTAYHLGAIRQLAKSV